MYSYGGRLYCSYVLRQTQIAHTPLRAARAGAYGAFVRAARRIAKTFMAPTSTPTCAATAASPPSATAAASSGAGLPVLDISKKNLGCVVSGKLTLCCSAEERARLHALKRATAVDVVRALAEVELAYPGESMYVIFIAAHEPAAIYELGERWCPLSSKAERAIAEVWARRAHGGRPILVEIAIPRAEWLDENTPHPLSVSRQFSLRSLPVIVQWCKGRAGKRLTYPSNSDQAALTDYFGMSVEPDVPSAIHVHSSPTP